MYWALSTRQKFWFEISEIPHAQWNSTFRFHRTDPGHRTFGYCSCKQDTKERYWGQQFCQMERDVSIRPTDRPTEMSAPLSNKRWSQIFRSDWTEMIPGFYLGFIVWERSPEWPRVSWRDPGAFLPGIFWNGYALRCNLVHFETQFWEMLQRYFILFFRHDHVPCHIVSLDREYLLRVHWPRRVWMIFSNIVTYIL